jgi:3' terminal RNA ribose 2'-O-methyltransferase Hen1
MTAECYPLDPAFPEWGLSPYYKVSLQSTVRLSDLLTHLYVLTPVLDDEKHYYVGADEVEKLLHRGEGWLSVHPARELIVSHYLKHRSSLAREALARLVEEDMVTPDLASSEHDVEEAVIEKTISLHEQRLGAVVAVLKNSGAKRVVDLGCGEGKLLTLLLREPQFSHILGMDVSSKALEIAADRLRLDRLSAKQRERVALVQGSLMYRDPRLNGFDAAAVVEVIEHFDPPRLAAFERVLFEFARPKTVALTTPNAEYNVMWERLPAGEFRHKDHRFEWTRIEFQTWAVVVAERCGYRVRFLPIGPEADQVGSPSQMGVFDRED